MCVSHTNLNAWRNFQRTLNTCYLRSLNNLAPLVVGVEADDNRIVVQSGVTGMAEFNSVIHHAIYKRGHNNEKRADWNRPPFYVLDELNTGIHISG